MLNEETEFKTKTSLNKRPVSQLATSRPSHNFVGGATKLNLDIIATFLYYTLIYSNKILFA
jgi:hypothetical protein